MPRTDREYAKRKIVAACNHLDNAVSDLAEIGIMYSTQHPDIEQILMTAAEGVQTSKTILEHLNKTI